jgi:hypothetical protein
MSAWIRRRRRSTEEPGESVAETLGVRRKVIDPAHGSGGG